MAIRIEHTGNNAEQIAALLDASGLFHAVSYDSSTETVSCFGADGKLRFRLHTLRSDDRDQAQFTFFISETSAFSCGLTVLSGSNMAVDTVYLCRYGMILSCRQSAVLLTKNSLGENLWVVGSDAGNSQADALRQLRVYAYGDRVRSSYPVNLNAAYNHRSDETVFVPFLSEPGSSEQVSYSPDAFFLPFYQFAESGAICTDTHRYLSFAGCWAVSDD